MEGAGQIERDLLKHLTKEKDTYTQLTELGNAFINIAEQVHTKRVVSCVCVCAGGG